MVASVPCSYDLDCGGAHTRNITPGITMQQEHHRRLPGMFGQDLKLFSDGSDGTVA